MRCATGRPACNLRTPHHRRCLVVRAFRSSSPQQQDSQPSLETAPPSKSNVVSSSSAAPATAAVTELVAQPSVMCSALAGFCLVAAGVFVPLAQDADNSGSSDLSTFLARSAFELLNSGSASAAQMAPPAAPDALLSTAADAASAATTTAAAAAPAGTGFLLSIDQAAHAFVTANTSYDWRALQADVFISDSFIAAGIAGWVACSVACLALDRSWRSVGPLAMAWAFYYATCGAVGHGDPPLVATLKDAFARVRPSTLHHTYSFPSGHTSAAVFIIGALVVVLLPLTVQLLQEKATGSGSSSSSSSQPSEGTEDSAAETSSIAWGRLDMWGALGVWGAAWVVTATGRVLADAHWVTDTLAGGMLAVAVVSALAQCCKLVAATTNSSSSSGGGAAGL
uniref:Phosphatidic acid phosphatase type 2/haloperoxidase domain-containing protein n=1 Tax=Tetradesmus obliquus TaxID=3088 RepID=A0A383VL17_TETOB|eukprot:jgi/Sobl393_1/15451/SZX65871.1